MGRRIWVVVPPLEGSHASPHVYSCRVLSFNRFLPAGPVAVGEPSAYDSIRAKHMVKLWTDPGGTRVLTVGSIRLKDPGRSAGAVARAAREREAAGSPA